MSEIKENRVQEAVHAGKRPGALIDDRKQVSRGARCIRQSAHHHVHGLCDVEGQEAYTKHRRHHNYHPHRLVPFLPSSHGDALVGHGATEDLGHPAVTHHHAYERQQEAEAGQSHAIRIVVYRMLRRAQIVTHCAVSLDSRGGKVKSRCTQEDDHQPHHSADAPRHPATAWLVPHRHRMANAHIALHTDAGEEEDAAVEITKTGKLEQRTLSYVLFCFIKLQLVLLSCCCQ